MEIQEAIHAFLLDHKGRGSRPRTIEWYDTTLKRLLKLHLSEDVSKLTVFLINQLMSDIRTRDVSTSTLANYDRALRGFCNWLFEVEVITRNPFKGRKRIKESFQLKQVLTVHEINALLSECKKDTRFRYRNQSIILLFLDTGIRAAELTRLKLTDIDWDHGILKINGKTGYSSVPCSRKTLKMLRQYVTRERRGTDPHLYLYDRKPLNTAAVSHLLNRIAKRAGITRPVGTHLLRHTFATHFLRNGGDQFSLQRILRHTTPAMTSRYLHFITDDLVEKVARFSPVSRTRVE